MLYPHPARDRITQLILNIAKIGVESYENRLDIDGVRLDPNGDADCWRTDTEPHVPYATEVPGVPATGWPMTTRPLTLEPDVSPLADRPVDLAAARAVTEPTVISPLKKERPET